MFKSLSKLFPRFGIQAKLNFLLILLATLPLAFISIYVIEKQINVKEEEAIKSVKHEVVEIKSKISIVLSRIKEEMTILSRTQEINNILNNIKEKSNTQLNKENYERDFLHLIEGNDLYYKVDLLDKIGKKITSAIFEKDSIYIYPKSILSKKPPVLSYLYMASNMKRGDIKLSPQEAFVDNRIIHLFDFVNPIFDENNELAMILVSSIRSTDFLKSITMSHGTDSSAKVVIMDGNGFYVHNSQRKVVWLDSADQLRKDFSKSISDSILFGKNGSISDDPERIIEYAKLTSFGENPSENYIIYIEIPKSVVLSSVNQLRNLFILICLGVGALSIIAGYYTAKSFTRPINQLVQGTRIIREGNLDYKLEIKTHDEIQDLVMSFNQMVGYWKQARELEQRQRMEEYIREQKKYLENIMDSSLDLLITVTSEGKISYANKRLEDNLGYNFNEFKGKDYLELFPVQFHPLMKQKWEDVKYQTGVVYDSQIMKADGTIIDCLMSISPLKGLNEYLIVIKDITERKQAEEAIILAKEKAEQANKLKTTILSNMGHELRTPMIGIMGFSKMLNDMNEINDVKEIGDLIVQSSKRLMETLNLILDISQIESGDFKLDITAIDLIEIIQVTISMFTAQTQEKNLSIKTNCKLENLYIHTDLKAIQSILNNLIDNSIKFTSYGGITLNIDKIEQFSNEFAVIEIIDTGIGIAEENMDTIFEAFRQASEGLARSHEGTGLGLTLIKKYIQLLGGKIEVKSKLGEGSTFIVYIPIIEYNDDYSDYELENEKVSRKD